jgi:prophage maintenance system killer protein
MKSRSGGSLARLNCGRGIFSNPPEPRAGFGGRSVFADLVEIAAAYRFYLCSNHPFVDGNKRTALGAWIVFLKLNGATPSPDFPTWETLTLDVAAEKSGARRQHAACGI